MSKFALFMVAVGALALTLVTLSPNSAEAGWRRWGWGGWGYRPGVSVYVGPRWGYYRPRYYPYGYYAYNNYPYAYYPYWRNRYWGGWY
jgi:hypothetical protein